MRVVAALLALSLVAACEAGGTPAVPDAVPDATPDAVADTAGDAGGAPAVPDTATDTAPDAAPDVAGDADGTPAVPDAVPDAAADAGPDTDTDAAAYPYPPAQAALIPLDGQLLCPAWFDGAAEARWMVVDTGAIRTAVDEPLLRDVANGVGDVTIDFGAGVVFPDYEVIAADLSKAVDHIGHPLAGLVGYDLFQRLWWGLDYRGGRVHVAEAAPSAPPEGFAEADRRALPYDVVQGYPVATVRVGDDDRRLIADTGSGVTLLVESSVPAAWLAGGVTGYVWHTSYGSDPGTIVRVPRLTVAGVAVPDSWAVVVPDDHHLRPVFDLVDIDVDGFLGYPVYRRFFIEVHGADARYDLFPYPDGDPVPAAEWDRVGLEIRRDEGRVVVDMVFAPSGAAAGGVEPEDVLVAIDGDPLTDVPLDDVRRRLRGAPGDTRTLTLERDGVPREVAVTVDRLLPLPETGDR